MANSEKTSTGVPPFDTIEKLFDVKAPPSSSPINGVVSSDVTIDPARSLWFRLYVPTSAVAPAATLPVVVYYHGGGFIHWSPDRKPYDDLCRSLARELSAIVVSINYRLAPEHRCPTQYDDGFEALKFIDRKKIDGFPEKADIGKCFVAGDSAGGNLAHHVAVKAAGHEFQALKILGLILLQPFFGAEERSKSEFQMQFNRILPLELTDSMWKQFLPDGSDRDHPAANVFGSKSNDISTLKFPPTLVIVGSLDPLRDWDRKYYEWLIMSGKEAKMVEYPNAPHIFYAFPEVPEYSMLINEVKGFTHELRTK